LLSTIKGDYGYGVGNYYSNHYAPIYSINTNSHKGRGLHKKSQDNNNLIIRNGYDTSYGGQTGYYNNGGYGGDNSYGYDYYKNHYAPVYAINNYGQNKGKGHNSNTIIRNSYSTSYGGDTGYDAGYYGDDSYGYNNGYNSQYSNCIINLNSHGKRKRKRNNYDLLLALLFGCGGSGQY